MEPFSAEEWRVLIDRINTLYADFGRTRNRSSVEHLLDEAAELTEEYYERLPRTIFAPCPYCSRIIRGSFDPYGLNGYWWARAWYKGDNHKSERCKHFYLLCGAVSYQGKTVDYPGPESLYTGPEVPYAIDREISQPDRTIVVSSIRMEPGYIAYPILYFAREKISEGWISAGWKSREDFHASITPSRNGIWREADTGSWIYDLKPYVTQGKVRWCEPKSDRSVLSEEPPDSYPYGGLTGHRGPVTVNKYGIQFNRL